MNNYFTIFTILILLNVNTLKAQTATCDVDANTVINPDTKRLLGITFDSRTGMNTNTGPMGYFDGTGNYQPGVAEVFDDFPIHGMRYPGNGIGTGFQWKKSIGLNRPNVSLLGNLGVAQPVNFGFDEYMTMAINRGVNPADIQIMIPIYDSAITYSTNIQNFQRVPFPIQNAADWVEYCNAPNDGSNWGGGEDWALRRSQNGRDLPYGIKIWNIGNEPWGPQEFAFTPAGFISLATPIIDTMLARDPSIQITLPAVGGYNSAWNVGMFNFANSHGGIYGLSPHYFMTEEVDTITNLIPKGVYIKGNSLIQLANYAATQNLKIIVGDYAHEVKQFPNESDKNIAMAWQGANLSTDFILLMSQTPNIVSANFWIFGNVYASWRAIREDSLGNYTSLPQSELFKILTPLVLDQSVAVINTSVPASDGNAYSVRSGAFMSNDQSKLNVIGINRDKLLPQTFQVTGITNHQLKRARIFTADTLSSEIIETYCINADANGFFDIPAFSFLVLEYDNSIQMVDACHSFTIGNSTYLQSGIFTDTIQNSLGCDSLVKTNLTIHSMDITISQNGTVLTSNQTNANYQWMDCNSNSIISGANSISFSPLVNGNYALIVNDFYCTDTSNCIQINSLSLSEYNNQTSFMFPNPSSENIQFFQTVIGLEIINSIGEIVLSKQEPVQSISISDLENGLYLVKTENKIFKLIIEK